MIHSALLVTFTSCLPGRPELLGKGSASLLQMRLASTPADSLPEQALLLLLLRVVGISRLQLLWQTSSVLRSIAAWLADS